MCRQSNNLLGNYIRHLRTNRGMTQAQVTEGLFERAYLSHIELGLKIPPPDTLKIIANQLQVSYEELAVLIPTQDSENVIVQIRSLLKDAQEHESSSIMYNAWSLIRTLHRVDLMTECVSMWSVFKELDFRLIEALKETRLWATIENAPSEKLIDLSIQLGNSYFRLGKFDEAIDEYQGILTQPISDWTQMRVSFNCAGAMYELGQFEDAQKYYQIVIESGLAKNRLANAYLGLASCLRYLGDANAAMSNIEKAAEISKLVDRTTYVQTQHAIGVLWLDKNETNIARHYLDYAWDFYEKNNMPLHLATLCEDYTRESVHRGLYERALDWANQGIALLNISNPHLSSRFYLWKGWIYFKQNRLQSATDSIQAAAITLQNRLPETLSMIDPVLKDELNEMIKLLKIGTKIEKPINFSI